MTIRGNSPSLHGRRVGVSPNDQLVASGGFVAGGGLKPSIVFPAPDVVAVFDDFLGGMPSGITDTGMAGTFFHRRAGDTGCLGAIAAVTNGVYRLTMSSSLATVTPAGTATGIVGPALAWKANMGPGGVAGRLRLGVRLKAATYTMGGIFVGFTDTVAAGEMPFYDTGDAQPTDTGQLHTGTVASDLVGFYFGENADTGWRGISAKSTAGDSGDQQVSLTQVDPTANTYQVLEVELLRDVGDTGGVARFYIDGVGKGQISSPVASNVALTPCVFLCDVNATGAAVLDIDWINVSAERDTGT